MSPLFTSIVIVMGLLAVMGIVVGVANDAVNFLNSALGSKAAPRRVILWIAAAGILVGTLTSSGMMEVARSGVFYPGQFSFPEIMMLFLGMMLGNILLLDIYNTLGLPTSTTVSMVFGLLGAGVGRDFDCSENEAANRRTLLQQRFLGYFPKLVGFVVSLSVKRYP